MRLTQRIDLRNTSRTNLAIASRILLLASISLFFNLHAAYAQVEVNSAEKALFDAVNRERMTKGLPELGWDKNLATAAHLHAARMAQRNALSHQLPGEAPVQDRARQAGAHFSLIAENIAVAPNPATIHAAWMASPHHRDNILDPQLTVIGIAVVKGSDGLFAVQDFSQVVRDLNLPQQEQQVVAQLRAHGMKASKPTEDARKTCDMNRGFAGTRPSSVVRFETTDLNKLPNDLEQKLQGGRYHNAAVGACTADDSSGFTRFRIAVVLY